MAVLHSCASCGLFGWKVRRRARWAAEIADAASIIGSPREGGSTLAVAVPAMLPVVGAYLLAC